MSWTVTVTREDSYWLAEVAGLTSGAHTEAQTLAGLDTAVREVIVLAEDLPDEAMPGLDIDYVYETGDKVVDVAAPSLRRHRAKTSEMQRQAAANTERLARELVARGYSVRDAAILAGVSYQRVSQLTRQAS